MKKRYFYLVSILLFIVAAGFIAVRYKKIEKKKDATFYPLQPRRDTVSVAEEWKQVRQKFDELMSISATNPGDIPSRVALASLYIQEARISGNYMYYDRAAMRYVNEILAKDPLHFEALAIQSLLYLSQHHFSEGLIVAEKAREANPYNAFIYGILVDANVELGDYEAAVAHADKMVSIRPDMRSYARISYLREIHGDYPGAIEAMKLAVNAGPPGDEATEWTRVQLAHLYEKTDDMKTAEMNYLMSLQFRPNYAYAIAGLGRIAMAAKDYTKAISFYNKADSLVNDNSIKEQLSELYELSGQSAKSGELNKWLINAMTKDAQEGQENDAIGHYADQELAYVYLRTKNYDQALQHALAEYNRRPNNIDVNETVAWMYYNKGEIKRSLPYLNAALKTKSNNPVLLCRAGLIYAKTGDKEKAKMLLENTLKQQSTISLSLRTQAVTALETL